MAEQKTAMVQDTNVKYSLGRQLLVTIEQTGYNSIYYWVSAFLTIYYTDVIGVAPAAVAGLLLGVRIFDAINDPIIGSLADRTRSRFGRYRPWVFVGGIFLAVLMVLLFNANPNWSYSTKVAYMYVFYILVTVASTCVDMTYAAMLGVMTTDGNERSKIMGKRMMFAQLGVNGIGLLAVPMIIAFGGGNMHVGYLFAVLITSCVGLPMMMVSSICAKEVVKPSPKQKKIPLKVLFQTVTKNPPAIVAYIGFFLVGFMTYGRMTMYAYYFTYFAGNAALFSTFSLWNGIGGMIGSGLITSLIIHRVKSKGTGFAYGNIICGILLIIMYFIPAPSISFFILVFFSSMAQSCAAPFNYSIIPDAVDYGEWKTSVRADGFIAAFQSFFMKIGGAVGPAVMVAIMGSVGYVANQAQTPVVLTYMNSFVTLVPGIMSIIIAIFYIFCYKLDNEKHANIVQELHERKLRDEAELSGTE